MSQKLCRTLPKLRQRTLVKIITNWRLQDAHKELRKRKSSNTEEWREKKTIIAAAGVLTEYERLWRREVTKYENECKDNMKKKVAHLRD